MIKKIILCFMFLVSILCIYGSFIDPVDPSDNAINNRLSYLNDVSSISFYKVKNRRIYIAFHEIPKNYKSICNASAFHASKLTDRSTYVYLIDPVLTNNDFNNPKWFYWAKYKDRACVYSERVSGRIVGLKF